VLEVLPACGCQGGLQRSRPLLICPCKSPDLIRCQSQVAKQSAERVAGLIAFSSCCRTSTGNRLCALALPNDL
jgi:hypothetical protein